MNWGRLLQGVGSMGFIVVWAGVAISEAITFEEFKAVSAISLIVLFGLRWLEKSSAPHY